MLLAAASAGAQTTPSPTQLPPQRPTEAAPLPPDQNAPPAAPAPDIAVLQGLDKVSARISRFDAHVNTPVHFGSLVITVRACFKRPPEEAPETAAFLDIDEVRSSGQVASSKRVFTGWMFASSPAVSAMQDPIYDVNVLDCKSDATAAPSSGPTGK